MAPQIISVTKTLSGLVKLTPLTSEVYDFVAPNPNTLNVGVLNEVYIHCDTTLQPVKINLPSISTLGGYSAKIYIVDVAGLAGKKNITVVAFPGSVSPLLPADSINTDEEIKIANGYEGIMLCILSDTQWHSN
jgi:hypothetical protein